MIEIWSSNDGGDDAELWSLMVTNDARSSGSLAYRSHPHSQSCGWCWSVLDCDVVRIRQMSDSAL